MYRTEEAVIPLSTTMKKCAWDIDVFEEQRNLAERIRKKKRHSQIVAKKRLRSVRRSGLSTTWKPFRLLADRARRKQKSFSTIRIKTGWDSVMTNIKKLHIHSDVKMTKLSALSTKRGGSFTGVMVPPVTE